MREGMALKLTRLTKKMAYYGTWCQNSVLHAIFGPAGECGVFLNRPPCVHVYHIFWCSTNGRNIK